MRAIPTLGLVFSIWASPVVAEVAELPSQGYKFNGAYSATIKEYNKGIKVVKTGVLTASFVHPERPTRLLDCRELKAARGQPDFPDDQVRLAAEQIKCKLDR